MGAQKFMGAQKLLRGDDAIASLRHRQMAPGLSVCLCATVSVHVCMHAVL